ncbi:hypothetical protein OUZ56_026431 [Daphnia magna]|uniref:Uncharacterized protein n=1 Tax=Daphnia magna TaxID=35525 RepID=A0ABQ9ZLR1_9CRUS|nr:hypothetical protein OUZ56_026431 [Daphnia magna]
MKNGSGVKRGFQGEDNRKKNGKQYYLPTRISDSSSSAFGYRTPCKLALGLSLVRKWMHHEMSDLRVWRDL